jgi:hypothetical protein
VQDTTLRRAGPVAGAVVTVFASPPSWSQVRVMYDKTGTPAREARGVLAGGRALYLQLSW